MTFPGLITTRPVPGTLHLGSPPQALAPLECLGQWEGAAFAQPEWVLPPGLAPSMAGLAAWPPRMPIPEMWSGQPCRTPKILPGRSWSDVRGSSNTPLPEALQAPTGLYVRLGNSLETGHQSLKYCPGQQGCRGALGRTASAGPEPPPCGCYSQVPKQARRGPGRPRPWRWRGNSSPSPHALQRPPGAQHELGSGNGRANLSPLETPPRAPGSIFLLGAQKVPSKGQQGHSKCR